MHSVRRKHGQTGKYAATKNVKITEIGIDEARKALATPKKNKPDDTSKGKPAKVAKGGVEEPGNEPKSGSASVAPDVALEGLETDEVFHTLQNVYEKRQDELRELTVMLAKHFGMTLMPQDTWDALAEAARTTPSDDASVAAG
jgi:hypothetical protein